MAAVLFICVLGQPLVLAHVDGFTAVGAHISAETRSATLRRMQLLCVCLVSAIHMVFMIGTGPRTATSTICSILYYSYSSRSRRCGR